ncbi:hypothetical protein JCGZ_23710 [Jatropha curcas]|uniref:Uncharacterized protein n=1 Tax=Jatropha curcas TaxID=180498 RepID=A0A067K0J2_JATCU|nr:hypothetical protein JCGZ_23710 [Jatropha curcas]
MPPKLSKKIRTRLATDRDHLVTARTIQSLGGGSGSQRSSVRHQEEVVIVSPIHVPATEQPLPELPRLPAPIFFNSSLH